MVDIALLDVALGWIAYGAKMHLLRLEAEALADGLMDDHTPNRPARVLPEVANYLASREWKHDIGLQGRT